MKYKLLISILIIVALCSELAIFAGSVQASTPWFNLSWTRRKAISIDNTLNPNNLVDYQVKINVNYASSMKDDFSDLRFTDSNGMTLISHWVESYVASVSAVVWVKIPNIPASDTTTIYMYYGNPSASSTSDGKATFEFFDDFETSSSSGWTDKKIMPKKKADATAAVYNNKLYVFGGYDLTAADVRKETYEYDPTLNVWTQKADMPTARWGPIAVQYGGKIYVFGGEAAPLQNVNKYSGNPLTTIPQYGASGAVHPDVIYFPEGKDGYKYWMVYTPYPPESKENPSIVRSNDGITWTAVGISNPVIPPGSPGSWNDLENPDPDFVYVSDYNKWFMVWDGGNQATDSRKIALAYSSNGKTWTQYDGISVNGNPNPIILSGDDTGGQSWERSGSISKVTTPTLLYENGVFYLFYAEEASGNNRGKVGYATFTWNNYANDVENLARYNGNPIIVLPSDGTFKAGAGHLDISKNNDVYYMYVDRVRQYTYDPCELALLTSTDKISWKNEGKVLGRGSAGEWDDQHIYRSSPTVDHTGQIVLFDNQIKMYYSAFSSAYETPRIGIAYISDTATTSTNEVYDPATNTWKAKAEMPSEIAKQGLMGVLYGNEIHLFYGQHHYVYYPSSDTYSRKADVPTRRTWGTCAVVNNKIYVIGGYSNGATNVNEVYNPLTDTWQTKSPLPIKLYGVTRENPVIDGKIYVTHGLNGGFHATVYEYDPSTDSWKQKSSGSHPRDGVASGVINGKLYVVGGRADDVGPYGLDFNEEYNPKVDVGGSSWSVSDPNKVYRDASAKHEGNYGLLINDDTTSTQYAEHAHNLPRLVVDVDWAMTDKLGIATRQPQGRILLTSPSQVNYGTLYYYNDGGAKFKWFTGSFKTLQSGSWNTWYHITIIWDGSNSKVIINGAEYSVSATQITSDRIRLESSIYEKSRMFFDLVRVRKYTSPEPKLNIGPEESWGSHGRISVDTTPIKGEVFVDGSLWGTAPVSREVEVGTYTVSFGVVTGYIAPADQIVTVLENTITTVTGVYTPLSVLNWTQTTLSDFNAGTKDNVETTMSGQSDGDVVLRKTVAENVVFSDNFNDNTLESGWIVDKSSKTQWIRIDLGSTYSVDTVKIYQSNFPNYFTKDYQIQVSTDGSTYNTVASNTLLNSINNLKTNTFTATSARYVRILIESYYTSGISQGLNEVEVFRAGYPATNIALNKPATASSQWSSNYSPSRAVDGLKGTTANSSPYPWLCADNAKAESNIVLTETNGALMINAPYHNYAHIERVLGLASNPQRLTVSARIMVQGYAGTSWRPQIALYWAPGDWCGIGVSNYDFITSVNVYASQTEGLTSYSGAGPNVYFYVRIELTSTSIAFRKSTDGVSWTTLRTVSRPASYSGPPSLLIVGKGYGNGGWSQGGYTYPNPNLDNDYLASSGSFATSYIDDVSVVELREQYALSGVFTSSIYDANFLATFKNIYWTATLSPGTSITLQTRTGNTSTPDASWSGWSIIYINSGEPIASPKGRYIQYRAVLKTTDATVTPILRDVTITYVET